jgi:hypothetical protein
MPSQRDTETVRAGDSAELGLDLWESLVRELIAEGVLSEAALARIVDSAGEFRAAPANPDKTRQLLGEIKARLERVFHTPLQRADRDRVPDTED